MKKIKRTDIFTIEKRSEVMSLIRSKNTKPELKVGKILYAAGLRYRKHNRKLFGTPDFSNQKRKMVVFVDSCFWHGYRKHYKEPKSNTDFWKAKISRNIKRGKEVDKYYKRNGWAIIRIWEHEMRTKITTVKLIKKIELKIK